MKRQKGAKGKSTTDPRAEKAAEKAHQKEGLCKITKDDDMLEALFVMATVVRVTAQVRRLLVP